MDVCLYIVSMILTYVIVYVIDKTKTIRSGECCYYQVAVFEYSVMIEKLRLVKVYGYLLASAFFLTLEVAHF